MDGNAIGAWALDSLWEIAAPLIPPAPIRPQCSGRIGAGSMTGGCRVLDDAAPLGVVSWQPRLGAPKAPPVFDDSALVTPDWNLQPSEQDEKICSEELTLQRSYLAAALDSGTALSRADAVLRQRYAVTQDQLQTAVDRVSAWTTPHP